MFDVTTFLKNSESSQAIADKIAELATNEDQSSFNDLLQFLAVKDRHTYDKHVTPALACRGLLQKGEKGVEAMLHALNDLKGAIHPSIILDNLWHASRGTFAPIHFLSATATHSVFTEPPSQKTIQAAKIAFRDFVSESQRDLEKFNVLGHWLFFSNIRIDSSELTQDDLCKDIFSTITESSIRISRKLLNQFRVLLSKQSAEEVYQRFLSTNPVLLDPLSSTVFPKQSLGLEFKTDYVVRRLDGEYILVEIEKPQDKIFTRSSNFSSKFSHAFGQIIDFLEWIDTHSAYAKSLMSGISSPRAMLIMGTRKDMSLHQQSKLKRLNQSLKNIEILTFDDVMSRGESLYANIHGEPEAGGDIGHNGRDAFK